MTASATIPPSFSFWLWTCRIIPLTVGGAWVFALLFTDAFTDRPPSNFLEFVLAPNTMFDGFGRALFEVLLIGLLAPHLFVVFIALPALLLPDRLRLTSIIAYVLFALLTAGFGPYLWYLFRVDPILSQE